MISSSITLDSAFTFQEALTATSFTVVTANDDMNNGRLEAIVDFGEGKTLAMEVFSGDAYNIDWTQEDLENAISAKLSGRSISDLV